jgi:syntaxin-binding protein 1
MDEYPFIRFHSPTDSNNPKINSLPEKLALKVQASIDEMSRQDASYPSESAGRGVLLIVERGIDVVAPLLHEYSYQAMVADLLDVETKYKYLDGEEEKEAMLDESDLIWVSS